MTEDTRELEQFLEGDVHEWVGSLPAYQREHVEAMLRTDDPIEVATTWLTSSGPIDTAPFGGFRTAGARFYENLLQELYKLFCSKDEYTAERKKLSQAAGTSKLMIVGTVSTAVAPHVGAAAVVIGPAVAITLGILGNAGKTTICATLSEMIVERDAAASTSNTEKK